MYAFLLGQEQVLWRICATSGPVQHYSSPSAGFGMPAAVHSSPAIPAFVDEPFGDLLNQTVRNRLAEWELRRSLPDLYGAISRWKASSPAGNG